MRFVYLGIETSGRIKLVLTATSRTVKTITVTPKKTGAQRVRVPIGRDVQGRYWSFRVENVLGADFSLYSIDALPVVLHGGIY